jgi:hypothetical protein
MKSVAFILTRYGRGSITGIKKTNAWKVLWKNNNIYDYQIIAILPGIYAIFNVLTTKGHYNVTTQCLTSFVFRLVILKSKRKNILSETNLTMVLLMYKMNTTRGRDRQLLIGRNIRNIRALSRRTTAKFLI